MASRSQAADPFPFGLAKAAGAFRVAPAPVRCRRDSNAPATPSCGRIGRVMARIRGKRRTEVPWRRGRAAGIVNAAMPALRWSTMLILCGALALHNALRIGPVPLVEELRARYGVDYAGVGNVIGAYTLSYAFAQLLAGFLTDRVGPKRLMLLGLGLAAVGSALFAVTHGYAIAVVARLLAGSPTGIFWKMD